MHSTWNPAPSRKLLFEPVITFDPLAWLKLQFFCHAGDTEIGGFGISAMDSLLHVQEFATVKQQVTAFTVKFLDDAVADHFDSCLEQGIQPNRCGRLWIHTHPGDSALPSSTDEETFARGFGSCDWAVMMILARSGQSYARLAFNTGPKAQIEIPVRVDWSSWPYYIGHEQPWLDAYCNGWQLEFDGNVQRLVVAPKVKIEGPANPAPATELAEVPWYDDPFYPVDEACYNTCPTENNLHDYSDPEYYG